MNPSMSVSNLFREHLINQLIALGDERERFLDLVCPAHGHERTTISKRLSHYTSALEDLLREGLSQELPVLIHTHVHLTYVDDGSDDRYTIVYPHEVDPEQNHISFLSPIGRELLLKSPGATVEIQVPAGTLVVRIEKITQAVEWIPYHGESSIS